jgi:hypothetical protein
VKHAIVITALCVAAIFVAAVWQLAPVHPRATVKDYPPVQQTGNRVDSQGRLDARGNYSLDAEGTPVPITAAQQRFVEPTLR